ncbi:unnamed protein product, partial [marine sediment metagenome]
GRSEITSFAVWNDPSSSDESKSEQVKIAER